MFVPVEPKWLPIGGHVCICSTWSLRMRLRWLGPSGSPLKPRVISAGTQETEP